MKLTPELKAWLVENKGVDAGADDETFLKAATAAVMDGSLSAEKMVELTAEKADHEASAFEKKLDSILSGQKSINDRLDAVEKKKAATETVDQSDDENKTDHKDAKLSDKAPRAQDAPSKSAFDKMFASDLPDFDTDDAIRVVGAEEQYSSTRSAQQFPEYTGKGAKHPYAGQRVFEGGTEGRRYIDEPSERDKAINGAYFKWQANISMKGRVPAALRMSQHERDLVQFALHEEKWGGVIRGEGAEDINAIGVHNRKLTDMDIKAVLDDAASGGLEMAPISFDDAIITTPLLTGEFFPHVNLVNVTRGRRMEGASIGNPTLSSGGADGTAIPLFNTASFISAFDTNIFVVNGSIELGLDFLSDSPVDVADIVTQRYGMVLLNWLDDQCVLGDGTTEPEGVNVASGTVSVNAENGAGGPPTVGDYEALLFGVPKQYKQGFASTRIRFGANETSYQRARSIAVGTTDQRRVFGMTHEDYQILNHPYSIGANIGNRAINFCNWGRYRMYRRLGLTMRVSTEGKELIRANQMLIAVRARFGGQLEDGNACAVIADGQS